MSIISFIQDAGERLFNREKPAPDIRPLPPKSAGATPAAAPARDADALDRAAADAIRKYLGSKGLATDKLEVQYDGETTTVTVSGNVPDQETREKIVLLAGNVANVHHVNDQLTVTNGGTASEYYVVKSGDTLSKIAQQHYGSANKYSAIFEANKPMLSDPDKIYPGQTLRIPRLS
jgi:nucleoid-associated protein YgaU